MHMYVLPESVKQRFIISDVFLVCNQNKIITCYFFSFLYFWYIIYLKNVYQVCCCALSEIR